MAKISKFDENYIGDVKEQLGYDRNSINIAVQSGGAVKMAMLFGAFAALSNRQYNMSLEKEGVLFIQRNLWTNKLEPEKYFFVPQEEIQEIIFKKGAAQHKLTITETNKKKTSFSVFKYGGKRLPFQAAGVEKLEELYGKK